MYRAIPSANKILSNKWQKNEHQIHMANLQKIKGTVDMKEPPQFKHLKKKMKKTQIPTAPDTTTESRATGAAAAAVPTGATAAAVPKQTQPDPQVVAVRPERQLSQLPLQKASASAWLATEQPDEPDWGTPADADTGTTRHATEQSHPDEHEAPELNGPGQEMSYVIVNAYLGNVTLESTEAERLIKQVILMTGEVFRPHTLRNIDEVFRPIFFYYPNYPDRTRGEPRNPSQYIREWRDIAAWRQKYLRPGFPIGQWRQMAGAGAPQHATEQLAKPQLQSILHDYIAYFIRYEADDIQRAQTWTRNKSRAEARLGRLCGHVLMAKAIWQVGLPNISEADSIATATKTILNWLSMVAN